MGLAPQTGGSTVQGPGGEKLRLLPDKQAHAAAEAEANAKAKVRRTVGGADEGQQVDRLATGVTVDAGALTSSSKREKLSEREEREGIIRFEVVNNDGTPKSSILLTGLKNLFQRQLPNMPREYITRLTFDRNAQGLAITQRGYKVVGGIAYRPFPQRQFAEIVFFAISGVYQVNGYGGHLMNHFKMHIKNNWPTIKHFLTYADNYAIGYFKKQGFKREITIPRELWVGYIKDYEGGTLMQCPLIPKVDYLDSREVLRQQREAIITKIRQVSKSHVVHKGLEQFRNAPPGFKMDPKSIPGLRDTGWTPEMDEMLRRPGRGIYFMTMKRLLTELKKNEASWPFIAPVNTDEVTDYLDVIKYPMDLGTMETKLERDQYPDIEGFIADARLIFTNCKAYNHEASQYTRLAIRMEKFLDEILAKLPSYKQERG
ncbi:Bromodomain-containing protein [Clavulina sp. PMI_390]|nr:Bromodomain-containing protein [Clavulina sp. PMI_390]